METKVKLRMFVDLKVCQNFVNSFCIGKNILRKDILPVYNLDKLVYFVFIEYS